MKVTPQEIVEALREISVLPNYQLYKAICGLSERIEQHGIAPSDNVKQADEETHRRVDEAVRNGRIEDRRAGGEAVSLSREDITRMARESGFDTDRFERSCTPQKCDIDIFDELSRFANAAYAAGAAAEREACEVAVSKVKMPYEKCASSAHAADCTIVDAIRAIRARGNGGGK